MKVALVNAPYIDLYGPIKTAAGRYFPLGIGYIASVLKHANHDVIIIDPEAEGINYEVIRERLKNFNPEIVGITTATPNFGRACKVAKIAKEVCAPVIIMGGAHASSLPEVILKNYKEIDIVCIGEGEQVMVELCSGIKKSEIKGIAYSESGGIFINPARPFIDNVDFLPFPAWEMVDLKWYRPNAYMDNGKKSATLITSRGCPSRCVFCASHTTLGKKFRAHSPGYVLNEIEYLIKNYGIEHFIFNDDTFTMNRKRVVDICNLILEKKIKIEWYCFARVNTVDEELLGLMKKAGCTSLGYGIESGNNEILKNLKKGIEIEQSVKALKISNKLGYKIFAFFILGCPGENIETIKQTIKLAKDIKPTIAFFNMLVPYPGTEIFNQSYTDLKMLDNWDNFVAIGVNPVVSPHKLPKEDLQKWVYRANVSFYLNPAQILRILGSIKSFKELLVNIKAGYGFLLQNIKWRAGNK